MTQNSKDIKRIRFVNDDLDPNFLRDMKKAEREKTRLENKGYSLKESRSSYLNGKAYVTMVYELPA